MKYLPAELIRKKRFGGEHTRDELHHLIQGYAQDRIPDYQMSAWLMAVCLKGMSDREVSDLTQEMRDSGVVLDFSALGVTVDKHSTGGVGDKTSLILAPVVAAAGVPVPMMAGRGLAHTGGTLDKLESISGFNVALSLEAFRDQVARVGSAIIGQTREFCPADRKLYALRDVTGTVDSLPLICGSIMSKKLAEGMAALALDVKFGSGAFMKTPEEAERLAAALIDIGQRAGKRVVALITRMDEPLGRFIGNALEVHECLEILKDRPGFEDTRELSLELAGHMIHLGGKAASPQAGRELAEKLLRDGSALAKFQEICRAQGGNPEADLPRAPHIEDVRAESAGYFTFKNVEKIGLAAVHLGAGRKFQSDKLDLAAGIEVVAQNGQRVAAGDVLFRLHHSDRERAHAALPVLREGFRVTENPVQRSPLIAKVMGYGNG